VKVLSSRECIQEASLDHNDDFARQFAIVIAADELTVEGVDG
jgi:hypothetical protein